MDEELEHDLNDLADYQGDSNDEGSVADEMLHNIETLEREHDTALVYDDGHTVCDKSITAEESQQHQQAANAALLIPGAPVGWKQPGPPEKWKVPKPKVKLGQPDTDFKEVDNPGGWSIFTFRPKFKYKGRTPTKFMHYAMPTDATPAPKKLPNDKRISNGWEFFHTGWTRESTDTPFSLFFHQLLLPNHDTQNGGSGIENDPRRPHYLDVGKFTEAHAITDIKVRGSGRGHRFKETSPQELVHWDGVVYFDGVLGGSKGAALRRWDRRRPDNSAFKKVIADSMTSTRWLEIKRSIKLNNNLTATKRGMPNHHPAQKFDLPFACILHNTNAVTMHSCLVLCGDETTWLNASWGEKGAGVIKRGLEKPGGSKGGQLCVVSDVDRIRVRAHKHRHKLHTKFFGDEGQNEVKMTCDDLLKMVSDGTPFDGPDGYDEDYFRPRPVFREKPYITWDNFFSGDNMLDWCAENGIGMTCTVDRGRLPKGVPSRCWHKTKTLTTDDRSRAARFENPIFAAKRQPE